MRNNRKQGAISILVKLVLLVRSLADLFLTILYVKWLCAPVNILCLCPTFSTGITRHSGGIYTRICAAKKASQPVKHDNHAKIRTHRTQTNVWYSRIERTGELNEESATGGEGKSTVCFVAGLPRSDHVQSYDYQRREFWTEWPERPPHTRITIARRKQIQVFIKIDHAKNIWINWQQCSQTPWETRELCISYIIN